MHTIKLSEFENTSVAKIDINGTTVAVFKVDEDYYAIQNMCSHSEADLADGEVYDCKVECPLHGAEFDLKTGEALTCLLYTSPSPRDGLLSRMPSSA